MTTRRTFSIPPAALPLWITVATGMFAARQNFAAAAVTADGRNVFYRGEMTRMTENYPPASTPSRRGKPSPPQPAKEMGTAEVVQDQAADLSHSSVQAGKHVAGVARGQVSGVAAEAGRQGRDLLRQAQDQLEEQAAQGQQRLAAGLVSLGDELSSMADGSAQGGAAADLARDAASRARDAGQWLGDRRPAQVVDEVQSFARRRPGVFLALAAAAGLVAGRLTRAMKAASSDGPAPAGGLPATGGVPARDTDTAYGDRAVLARGQAGSGVLR